MITQLSQRNGSRRWRWATCVLVVLTAIPMTVVQARPLGRAENSTMQSISTGLFDLTPVATATSSNTHSSFKLVVGTGAVGSLAVVNFGTLSVLKFTLTGSTATALRYCVNQAFKSGSSGTCADNTSAASVSLTVATTLATALAPGGYLTISETSSRTVNDTISVAVAQSQIVTHGTINS